MTHVLTVEHLTKRYPGFTLRDVSFALEGGKITGFIGRNGAGKSTTLNALIRLNRPDEGEIRFFDQPFAEDEGAVKQRIGFVSSGLRFYAKQSIRAITRVTKSFYPHWNGGVYAECLKRFALDEAKAPEQLSQGMKIKYALALALSHDAELLILDEPTSGLDPVSREDLLEVFLDLADQGKTILFSTHITSDLDKCADRILYLKKGVLGADATLSDFTGAYRAVACGAEALSLPTAGKLIGPRRAKEGYTALVRAEDAALFSGAEKADLETIMVHLEKEGN